MERGRSFFFNSSLSFFVLAFFFCKSQKKLKNKNKNKKHFPCNGVRSWLAYPESLHFQVFSLFLICRDRTRCTEKSIRSWEDTEKKLSLTVSDSPRSHKVHDKEHTQPRRQEKNFSLLFLIRRDRARCTEKSIHSQGKQQSETKT